MALFTPIGNEDPMSTLCRMVVETKFEDLPGDVVKCAKQSILDTIAVTIGGSGAEGIPAVVSLVKEKGGKPESTIPFYGGKVPASEAAFAIGPMARALDLGHIQKWAGHCSEYNLPAMMAVTGLRDKVNGEELITAFTAGQEVLIRIGVAYKFWTDVPVRSIGGHYVYGPVASAGKLLGLSQLELENAEGIIHEMTQPYSMAMHAYGSLMVRVHHGFVCQDAINACLLAKKGITGPRHEVLAGHRSYLNSARWQTDPSALTDKLGERWEMLTVQTKLYASCRCTHPSIDGILDLMKKHNFKAEDIARIDSDQSSRNIAVVCSPKEVKWHPQTEVDGQFSLPYCVATAAYDGTVFLDSYTSQKMARKEVRNLMSRISVKEDTRLPEYGSRLYVTLEDGRKFSGEYLYPKGDPEHNPITDEELINKFKRCVPYSSYKLSKRVVDSLIDTIMNLERVDDIVEALILPLTPK